MITNNSKQQKGNEKLRKGLEENVWPVVEFRPFFSPNDKLENYHTGFLMNVNIEQGLNLLQRGGVIAYPTEAVYGLGCDAFNEKAVLHLLQIKNRTIDQGLILLVANIEQCIPLIEMNKQIDLDCLKQTANQPTTWVFPANQKVPYYIKGVHVSIAIRLTDHPVARALCQHSPIVSTSANITGKPACKTQKEVEENLGHLIDGIVEGELGHADKPSSIIDAITKQILR